MVQVEAINILVISGSVRTPSYTRTLSCAVARELFSLGARVSHWDAIDPLLPIADPLYHKSASGYPDPNVVELDAVATTADAFVLATPIYHNSYSGVLKNILDLLSIEPHFALKPVGLVSHGGDRSPQALDHLRAVTRGLNSIAIPAQICTQRSDYTEGDDGYHLTNEDILTRIHRFASELIALAILLRPLQRPAAVQRLLALLQPDAVE